MGFSDVINFTYCHTLQSQGRVFPVPGETTINMRSHVIGRPCSHRLQALAAGRRCSIRRTSPSGTVVKKRRTLSSEEMASAADFSSFDDALQSVRQYEEETNTRSRFVVSKRRKAGK